MRPSGDRLPLVDLHVHQERSPRLSQVLAVDGRGPAIDWTAWSARLRRELQSGIARLNALWANLPTHFSQDSPEAMLRRFHILLQESAAAGAVLAEVRVGHETIARPGFVDIFREAESRVRQVHPEFHAGLVVVLKLWHEPREVESALAVCTAGDRDGPGGIDFLYLPYDSEADWTFAYRLAGRAADAGLGVTAHSGEFSSSNIAAALRLPGISRLGHAVHASGDPHLLELLIQSGVAVECCLTSNLVLGAVDELADHPIRRFHDAGIPVVLGTDNPLQFATTIAREYTLAASAGLTQDDLAGVSRDAIVRSFLPDTVKVELLALLSGD